MAKEYRSRPRITLELLRAIKAAPGVRATRLVSVANLSTERLQSYLADLEAKGLVEARERDGRRGHHLTEAGHRVLLELDRVDRFMADFGMGL